METVTEFGQSPLGGNIVGVESGAFGKSYTLEGYNKELNKVNTNIKFGANNTVENNYNSALILGKGFGKRVGNVTKGMIFVTN